MNAIVLHDRLRGREDRQPGRKRKPGGLAGAQSKNAPSASAFPAQRVEQVARPHLSALEDITIDGTMDAAITQDHQAMVLDCVRIFTNVRDGREPLTGVAPTQIGLFVRENLP
jgi:hypothetical protein